MCVEQGTKTAWQWSLGAAEVACLLSLFHSFLLGSSLTQSGGLKGELKLHFWPSSWFLETSLGAQGVGFKEP